MSVSGERTAAGLERCSIENDVAARLAARVRASVRIALYEAVVDVRFDDREAAELFRRRYVDFVATATPTQAMIVAGDRDATYWIVAGRAYRWPQALGDSEEIAFLTDTLVRHDFFTYGGSHVAFHAASLRVGGVAIAISGATGAGKTTTTIACARRGMAPYSDEQCVIANEYVVPFPRAIDVRTAAVATLAAEPIFADGGIRERLAARHGKRWTSARFADIFGASALPRPAPLAAIYFIVARGDAVAIEPLAIARALPLFFEAFPLGYRSGLARVADALAFVRQTRAFALTLGTPDATARALVAIHAA